MTLVLGLVGVVLVKVVQGLPEQRGPKLRGLRVAIGPDVAKERCREVVANIKVGKLFVLSKFPHIFDFSFDEIGGGLNFSFHVIEGL